MVIILLEGRGRVWRASTTGGHAIYIPADIVKDSGYPFKPKEEVHVQLDPENERIVISKIIFSKTGR